MRSIPAQKTPRCAIIFDAVPTVRASSMIRSVDRYVYIREYAQTLDTVLEHTDAVASANGWSLERAMQEVLKDRDLYILPRHQRVIRDMLAE